MKPPTWAVSHLLPLLLACACACRNTEPGGTLPSHHDPDGGFRNPQPTFSSRGFSNFLHFALFTDRRTAPDEADLALAPEEVRWRPDGERPDWEAVWIGHATVLVKMGDRYLLTDPVFSERASPVSFAGPQRHVAPGIALEDLPSISAVLISHNHYDALDRDSVLALNARFAPRFYAPLGVGEWLRNEGIANVAEMDWWDIEVLGDWKVHCVPVQHFSSRTPFDRNETLWSGWHVQAPDGALFFAGDTGYSPDFLEVRRRFGAPRLALIPIGAYEPRDFMSPVHVDPAQALQIHLDLEAAISLGIHWGTFRLANEPLTEPPKKLAEAMAAQGVAPTAFRVLRHGEAMAVPPN